MGQNLSAGDRRLHSWESNSFVAPFFFFFFAFEGLQFKLLNRLRVKSIEACSCVGLIKTADYSQFANEL